MAWAAEAAEAVCLSMVLLSDLMTVTSKATQKKGRANTCPKPRTDSRSSNKNKPPLQPSANLPSLHAWQPVLNENGNVVFEGVVLDHPNFPGNRCVIRTSTVKWKSDDATMCVTASGTVYRLSPPDPQCVTMLSLIKIS